jgi:hypothetical protein
MEEKQEPDLALIEQLEMVTKPAFAELGYDADFGTVTVSAKGQARARQPKRTGSQHCCPAETQYELRRDRYGRARLH